MPFGSYDQEHRIFDKLKRQIISVVVLEQAGRNLPVLYSEHNLEIINLPISNYGVPAQEPLEQAVNKTIDHARLNRNILIHCAAGIGRTAFFAAFLAMKVLKLPGRQAIRWIGQCYPRALLTPVQIDMILEQDTDPIRL